MASLAADDAEFRAQTNESFVIRRITTIGTPQCRRRASGVADLATSDESILVAPADPQERTLLSLLGAVQIFVPNDLPDEEAARLHRRAFDNQGLSGVIAVHYNTRSLRRAAWGMASLTLTDQRIIGVVYDEPVPGVRSSPERAYMPAAAIDAETMSVIGFSCDRAAFDDHSISSGLGQSRTPIVHLNGDVTFVLLPLRTVSLQHGVAKPEKHQVATAIRSFVPAST